MRRKNDPEETSCLCRLMNLADESHLERMKMEASHSGEVSDLIDS